jgi:hypothetical protein
MAGTGRKREDAGLAKNGAKNDTKSRKSPPTANEDDDIEDGDIATPKRDRDDEQQDL